MAVRTYNIQAEGWDGLTYKVTLTDTRESNGSTTLVDAQNFLSLAGGEKDDTRKRSLWPREGRLRVLNNSSVEALASATGQDVRATVNEKSTGDLVYKGYVLGNQYKDRPLAPKPNTIGLTLTDGLPTLRNVDFNELPSNVHGWPKVTVARLLNILLRAVHDTPIPIELGMNYYPKTSSLTSSDCPLQNVTVDPDNYRQNRPDGQDWLTCYEVLKDILKPFGLICRQSKRRGTAVWHVRQHQEASATIDLWEVTQEGSPQLGTGINIERSISSNTVEDRVALSHARDFPQRPLRKVVGTHDLASAPNYVSNPGFEEVTGAPNRNADPARWTFGGSFNKEQIFKHDTLTPTPLGVKGNELVFRLTDDGSTTNGYAIKQAGNLWIAPPDVEISLSTAYSGPFKPRFRCAVGNYTFIQDGRKINGQTNSGRQQLRLKGSLPVPIPSGQSLPIYNFDNRRNYVTSARIEERAESGDLAIEVSLNDSVQDDDAIFFLKLIKSPRGEDYIDWFDFLEPDKSRWQNVQLRASLQAESGTQVTNRNFDVKLGGSLGNDSVKAYFDEVRVTPLKDGEEIVQVESAAETEGSGKTESFTSRLGSGPSVVNLEKLEAFPSATYTWTVVSISASNNEIVVSGDKRGELNALNREDLLEEIYVANQGKDTGFYDIASVSYDSNANETTIGVDATTHPIRTSSVDASTEVRVKFNYGFDAIYWGLGPDPQTTYPLHELHARQRLRYFRGNVERIELSLYIEEDISRVRPHQFVTLEGKSYTVSSVDYIPTEGTQSVTLLRHNDFGTA